MNQLAPLTTLASQLRQQQHTTTNSHKAPNQFKHQQTLAQTLDHKRQQQQLDLELHWQLATAAAVAGQTSLANNKSAAISPMAMHNSGLNLQQPPEQQQPPQKNWPSNTNNNNSSTNNNTGNNSSSCGSSSNSAGAGAATGTQQQYGSFSGIGGPTQQQQQQQPPASTFHQSSIASIIRTTLYDSIHMPKSSSNSMLSPSTPTSSAPSMIFNNSLPLSSTPSSAQQNFNPIGLMSATSSPLAGPPFYGSAPTTTTDSSTSLNNSNNSNLSTKTSLTAHSATSHHSSTLAAAAALQSLNQAHLRQQSQQQLAQLQHRPPNWLQQQASNSMIKLGITSTTSSDHQNHNHLALSSATSSASDNQDSAARFQQNLPLPQPPTGIRHPVNSWQDQINLNGSGAGVGAGNPRWLYPNNPYGPPTNIGNLPAFPPPPPPTSSAAINNLSNSNHMIGQDGDNNNSRLKIERNNNSNLPPPGNQQHIDLKELGLQQHQNSLRQNYNWLENLKAPDNQTKSLSQRIAEELDRTSSSSRLSLFMYNLFNTFIPTGQNKLKKVVQLNVVDGLEKAIRFGEVYTCFEELIIGVLTNQVIIPGFSIIDYLKEEHKYLPQERERIEYLHRRLNLSELLNPNDLSQLPKADIIKRQNSEATFRSIHNLILGTGNNNQHQATPFNFQNQSSSNNFPFIPPLSGKLDINQSDVSRRSSSQSPSDILSRSQSTNGSSQSRMLNAHSSNQNYNFHPNSSPMMNTHFSPSSASQATLNRPMLSSQPPPLPSSQPPQLNTFNRSSPFPPQPSSYLPSPRPPRSHSTIGLSLVGHDSPSSLSLSMSASSSNLNQRQPPAAHQSSTARPNMIGVNLAHAHSSKASSTPYVQVTPAHMSSKTPRLPPPNQERFSPPKIVPLDSQHLTTRFGEDRQVKTHPSTAQLNFKPNDIDPITGLSMQALMNLKQQDMVNRMMGPQSFSSPNYSNTQQPTIDPTRSSPSSGFASGDSHLSSRSPLSAQQIQSIYGIYTPPSSQSNDATMFKQPTGPGGYSGNMLMTTGSMPPPANLDYQKNSGDMLNRANESRALVMSANMNNNQSNNCTEAQLKQIMNVLTPRPPLQQPIKSSPSLSPTSQAYLNAQHSMSSSHSTPSDPILLDLQNHQQNSVFHDARLSTPGQQQPSPKHNNQRSIITGSASGGVSSNKKNKKTKQPSPSDYQLLSDDRCSKISPNQTVKQNTSLDISESSAVIDLNCSNNDSSIDSQTQNCSGRQPQNNDDGKQNSNLMPSGLKEGTQPISGSDSFKPDNDNGDSKQASSEQAHLGCRELRQGSANEHEKPCAQVNNMNVLSSDHTIGDGQRVVAVARNNSADATADIRPVPLHTIELGLVNGSPHPSSQESSSKSIASLSITNSQNAVQSSNISNSSETSTAPASKPSNYYPKLKKSWLKNYDLEEDQALSKSAIEENMEPKAKEKKASAAITPSTTANVKDDISPKEETNTTKANTKSVKKMKNEGKRKVKDVSAKKKNSAPPPIRSSRAVKTVYNDSEISNDSTSELDSDDTHSLKKPPVKKLRRMPRRKVKPPASTETKDDSEKERSPKSVKSKGETIGGALGQRKNVKKSKEVDVFLQKNSCYEMIRGTIVPRNIRCLECRRVRVPLKNDKTPSSKSTPKTNWDDFCRFYHFRKLTKNSNETLTAGFSNVDDAQESDFKMWLPDLDDKDSELPTHEASKYIIENVGEEFCNLVKQEKAARELYEQERPLDQRINWKRTVCGLRELCDVCSTTLFNCHYVCERCGFVVCIDCYQSRAESRSNNNLIKEVSVKKEKNTSPDNSINSDNKGPSENGDGVENVEQVAQTVGKKSKKDSFGWIYCAKNEEHSHDKLVLTQIIAGNCLEKIQSMLHEARKKLRLNPCSCLKEKKNNITVKMEVSEDDNANELSEKNNNAENEDTNSDGSHSTLKGLLLATNSGNNATGDNQNLTELDCKASPTSNNEEAKSAVAVDPIKMELFNDEDDSQEDTKLSQQVTAAIEGCISSLPNGKEDDSLSTLNCMSNDIFGDLKRFKQYPSAKDSSSTCNTLNDIDKLESETHSWLCNNDLLVLSSAKDDVNKSLFQKQWRLAKPVLVRGVHERMDIDSLWLPQYFGNKFGDYRSDLVDCRNGDIHRHSMKKYWEGFEPTNGNSKKKLKDDGNSIQVPSSNNEELSIGPSYYSGSALWRLKDWPPGQDFNEILPEHFSDFMDNLPLHEYTTREGDLNLAARLPPEMLKPDLGPKMYSAYGTSKFPERGTTNLHLDISDAINVMVYVSGANNGSEDMRDSYDKTIEESIVEDKMKQQIKSRKLVPGALWHIFKPSDAQKMREFLNKVADERKIDPSKQIDPIHDQTWYLDQALLDRLYNEYNVKALAILQCMGDAILIPAGAPHQVKNLQNCIKVANDFVSPENVRFCLQLTNEFRNLPETHMNQEDKLQIKNIIYHSIKQCIATIMSSSSHNGLEDDEPQSETNLRHNKPFCD